MSVTPAQQATNVGLFKFNSTKAAWNNTASLLVTRVALAIIYAIGELVRDLFRAITGTGKAVKQVPQPLVPQPLVLNNPLAPPAAVTYPLVSKGVTIQVTEEQANNLRMSIEKLMARGAINYATPRAPGFELNSLPELAAFVYASYAANQNALVSKNSVVKVQPALVAASSLKIEVVEEEEVAVPVVDTKAAYIANGKAVHDARARKKAEKQGLRELSEVESILFAPIPVAFGPERPVFTRPTHVGTKVISQNQPIAKPKAKGSDQDPRPRQKISLAEFNSQANLVSLKAMRRNEETKLEAVATK